jgi:cytidine deaminase
VGAGSGGYLESAAYNPSLPPLQAALVAAVVGGLRDLSEVRGCACPLFAGSTCYTRTCQASAAQVAEVVLVERADASVRHAATTQLMVAAIAPSARLTVLPAETGDKRVPHACPAAQ